MERIYHLALAADWEAARAAGEYVMSTRGRTLAEEGFIHCSRPHQVAGVHERYYQGAGALVLLEIDPAAVGSPIVDEVPPGATDAFPHIYGPLPVAAVVATHPYP